MDQPFTPVRLGRNNPQSDAHTLRLQGRRLLFTRTTSMIVSIATFGLFLAAIPLRYVELSHPSEAIQRGLAHLGLSVGFYRGHALIFALLLVGAYTGVAAVLFWRRSNEWMALFVACFLVIFEVTQQPTLYALADTSVILAVLVSLLTTAGWIGLNLFFLLFPSGQFMPRWTRWFAPVSVCYVILWRLPETLPLYPANWPFPLAILMEVGALSLNLSAQIYRYRHVSNPIQRMQTKWLVFASVLTLAAVGGNTLWLLSDPSLMQPGSWYDLFGSSLLAPFALLIPIALGIAILRYHLWGIDVIINHTLVYGILTSGIVGTYILIVGYLGALFRAGNNLLISLVATGLVAVLFQPLRSFLQKAVNRLMYGDRDTPYKAIARLGQRLEAAFAPETVLPTIAETVAQSLKLPYVALTLKQGNEFLTTAFYGSVQENLVHLPLIYQNETIGELVLAPRAAGERFSTADQRLLTDLGRQAGIAVHAVRLTTDLQRSRERLVMAREEERRRIHRDLHDGLGPTLGALVLKAGSARALFPSSPSIADRLMGELEHDIETAVLDIRRLVSALRPPALDELGLGGAIRACSTQSTSGANRNQGPRFQIEIPEYLPPLSAAVEVATYRIAQEALTNVLRHAQAKQCTLRLTVADTLRLEVSDDGIGLALERRTGVGLTSMRERTIELGGTWTMESPPSGGTRILACFPLSHESK